MPLHEESVKSYMKSIADVPRIRVEDEADLAELIGLGSEKARERLIVSNLRLVVKIANDFKALGVPLADLISEGNIGLMKAVEKFKAGRGAKFSSYGAWWIKQAIRRAIAEQSRVIRIPIQSAVKIRKIQHAAMELAERLGRIPSEDEIAQATEISRKTIGTLRVSATANVVSLSEPLQDGELSQIGDMIADTRSLGPDELLGDKDVRDQVLGILRNRLKERERVIICLRFGLDGHPAHTLDEVSAAVGRTRERVRQIQQLALRKIHFYLHEPCLV